MYLVSQTSCSITGLINTRQHIGEIIYKNNVLITICMQSSEQSVIMLDLHQTGYFQVADNNNYINNAENISWNRMT